MVTETLPDLVSQTRQWTQTCVTRGWFQESAITALDEFATQSVSDLFDDMMDWPLVVALVGGTGVGKSTLLNRLAGETIARTGVVRPTSREVTVYLHASLRLKNLPPDFPVAQVVIAQHKNDTQRQVVWLDTPDFDSTETEHREWVLAWLPYIDLVVYVVTPERYRDDSGWRLMLSHGRQHAWMFVINHWDEGAEAQRQDFADLLGSAGFQNPVVLCTDSRNDASNNTIDEFPQLRNTIRALASRHTTRQLVLRGQHVHREQLQKVISSMLGCFADQTAFENLKQLWSHRWQAVTEQLSADLAWPLNDFAARYARRENSVALKMIRQLHGGDKTDSKNAPVPAEIAELPWGDWADTRIKDALNSLLTDANAVSLPASPFRAELEAISANSITTIIEALQRQLRSALATPGSPFQRILHRVVGKAVLALPLLAMAWIAYGVVVGFYTASTDTAEYLGVNFAVHSALLLATAWLLPWLLHRNLQPSLQKAAHLGLTTGLDVGFAAIHARVSNLIEQRQVERNELVAQVKQITQRTDVPVLQQSRTDDELLDRYLIKVRDTDPAGETGRC